MHYAKLINHKEDIFILINKMKRYTLFPIVIIFVILIVVSCTKIGFSDQSTKGEVSQLTNPSSSTTTLDEIRKLLLGKSSGQEGAVTVDIFLATPEFFKAFAVDLNTHSVDLSNLEMDKISSLRDDQGNVYSLTEWREVGDSSSSHHRSGALLFPLTDQEGEQVISDKTKYIEIIIKDLAGVKERLFRWDLPIKYPESS